ncbi:MAG TPA: adenylate/guanylate cyclase domain-containing protein [Candidatus Binatia bacterium]|nr:adenylate/guanylate cyclase domain-containing protein [Candidatus Binatia bacterium]
MSDQVIHCADCGATNPSGGRFCTYCGHALAKQGAEMALRRILTIVFIDLVGSTRMAASEDLEAYDRFLRRYHVICNKTLAAYGGVVLRLEGDGVLACFGLSEDSENAALSAVAACLSIAREVPRQLPPAEVRVGIHSGAVFCRVHASGELSPDISGLDVNVAARVQATATPGAVVITAATMDFVARIAKLEAVELGPVGLKGVPESLVLYRVDGYAFDEGRQAAPGLVERDEIVETLTAAGPSAETASPATVVVGPAGIGKSALVAEIARRLDSSFLRVPLHARLNLRHTPLFPIAEWLAQALVFAQFPLAEIAETADLEARVERFLPGFPADQLPIVADVLGIPSDASLYARYAGPQIREMRIAVLVEIVSSLMSRRPILLTFDDFHWADQESSDFVDRVLAKPAVRRSRVVITGRPGAEMSELARRNGLRLVQVPPLSESGARDLVERAGGQSLGEEDKTRIVALAEGNPLFLRTLLNFADRRASAGKAGTLPPTIEATFQGIVNSLGPAKTSVLVASVIGRTFTTAELGYLTNDGDSLPKRLTELARGGIVEQQRIYWQFTHVLLRDAAYNMIPSSQRRELHKRFADALAANEPKRVEEFPELLADHYLASGDVRATATSCVQAGIGFLRRASFDRAVRYLELAVEAAKNERYTAEDREQVYLTAMTLLAAAKVQRCGFSHPETGAAYQELEAAVRDVASYRRERMLALYGLFAHRMISGDVRACRLMVREMERVADPGDPQQQLLRLVNVSAYALYSGEFSQSLEANEALRAIYRTERDRGIFLQVGADPLVSLLTADANVFGLRGELARAEVAIDAAREHLEAIGAILQRPWVMIFTAVPFFYAGEADRAIERIEAGIVEADSQGAAFWSLLGRVWLSVFASECGTPETGPLALGTLLEHYRAIGVGLNEPLYDAVLARDLHRESRSDEALSSIVAACRRAARWGQGQFTAEIWRMRASIHRVLGDARLAERCWRIGLCYARRSAATVLERRILDDMARD